MASIKPSIFLLYPKGRLAAIGTGSGTTAISGSLMAFSGSTSGSDWTTCGSDSSTKAAPARIGASETGSSLIMDSGYQQLIWWVYSASDFSISNNVIIRITGSSGTAWDVKRLCETTP